MTSIYIYLFIFIALVVALIATTVSKKKQQKTRKETSNSNDNNMYVTNKNISDCIPIKDYEELYNAFKHRDGYMDLLQINSKDLGNASEDAITYDRLRFAKLYKKYDDDLKIIISNFPSDTSKQQQYVNRKIAKTRNPIYKKWLFKKLDELIWVEKNRTSREFYYMFWGKDEEDIIKKRDDIKGILGTEKNGLVSTISKEKKISIIRKMTNKNAMIMGKGITSVSSTGANENEVNVDIIKEISPMGGITFKDESVIKTGDGYESCLNIYNYPAKELDDFWLSNITNYANTIVTIDISNEDISVVRKNINRSMSEQETRYESASKYTDKSEATKQYNEMKELADEISGMEEVIKVISSRIFVADRSWLELDTNVKSIKKTLESKEYQAYVNLNETKADWTSMFDSYSIQQKNRFSVAGQTLTANTLAGGNPFHFSALEDVTGMFMGTTPTGGNVFLDIFLKTMTRKQYNGLAIGNMGSGKSTLLKKILEDRAIREDYVRTFDISGEFSMVTNEYGGRVLKMDGTDETALNPLEILKAGDDESTNYMRHISKLKIMYKFLVPSCTDEILTEFSNCLYEFYDELSLIPGEGRQITGLKADEYPIFSDLRDFLILKNQTIANGTYNEVELELAKIKARRIEMLIDTITNLITNYGSIFNRHTSLDNVLDEQILTFNISKLKDMDSTVFDAQIFSLVSLCWDNAVSNGSYMYEKLQRGKIDINDVVHFLILIDESHRWINTSKLQALDLILTYMREGRKYFAGIMFASQSIRDYVPEGSDAGAINKLKTLFELTQYKFIFMQDSNAVPLIQSSFGNVLTDSQYERIPLLEQGSCILSIASDMNLEFNVFITDEEEAIFQGGV